MLPLSANYICLVLVANWLPARVSHWEALAEDWTEERRERTAYFSLCLSLLSGDIDNIDPSLPEGFSSHPDKFSLSGPNCP